MDGMDAAADSPMDDGNGGGYPEKAAEMPVFKKWAETRLCFGYLF